MRYFTAVVHQDGNSAYGLTFPDLPGCFAAADDWDGISAAATEALDLWFDDEPDVAPASLEAIRKRADVVEAVAAGAVLMPVPYIPADTAMERVNVSMERGLLRAIDETARTRGMTRSSFLAAAARILMTGTSIAAFTDRASGEPVVVDVAKSMIFTTGSHDGPATIIVASRSQNGDLEKSTIKVVENFKTVNSRLKAAGAPSLL